jgi:hypothetical protein
VFFNLLGVFFPFVDAKKGGSLADARETRLQGFSRSVRFCGLAALLKIQFLNNHAARSITTSNGISLSLTRHQSRRKAECESVSADADPAGREREREENFWACVCVYFNYHIKDFKVIKAINMQLCGHSKHTHLSHFSHSRASGARLACRARQIHHFWVGKKADRVFFWLNVRALKYAITRGCWGTHADIECVHAFLGTCFILICLNIDRYWRSRFHSFRNKSSNFERNSCVCGLSQTLQTDVKTMNSNIGFVTFSSTDHLYGCSVKKI